MVDPLSAFDPVLNPCGVASGVQFRDPRFGLIGDEIP